MADANEILQLGIEAARDGNREEARNLFTLLTRQEPDNIQGWLWLAGVSDTADQRRAALERAIEIDPQNEMALRGLRAMGGTRGSLAERGRNLMQRTGAILGGGGRRNTADNRQSSGRNATANPVITHEEELTAEFEAFEEEYDDGRGPSPFMWGILLAIALVLVVYVGSQFFMGGSSSTNSGSFLDGLFGSDTAAEASPEPTTDALATATPRATMTAEPTPEPTAVPLMDIGLTESLNNSGWEYGIREPLIFGDRTDKLSDVPPTNGRYVVLVVVIGNTSGNAQSLPEDFFVLTDDQGREYKANFERSNTLFVNGGGKGVVSDLGVYEVVTSNVLQSVPLIFDVHADATNLRLYGGNNRSQGWLIAAGLQ
jgi:hypothetical protein